MPPPESDSATSASLLLRVRDAADGEAWRTFEAVYGPLVRRSCVRRGLQHADAADVSQEVLARVARAIRGFEYAPERGRFRAWLNTITANAVRSHLARAAPAPNAPGPEPAADAAWDDDFTRHVLAVACDRVRGEFEPATWAAFEAVWVRDEPPADVAARLGIALHAVYVNKSRVLKRLETEVRTLADDLPVAE
jgi:RNA polymerase sigma factor (sigma-70 family)